MTCVPRVFLNTVYGYREISVGVYRISPTDRSRFYVTDRGHSRKERSSFSLFLQAFSPRRYRIYCRPIATDNISPRLSNCFVPFSFSLFCLRNDRRWVAVVTTRRFFCKISVKRWEYNKRQDDVYHHEGSRYSATNLSQSLKVISIGRSTMQSGGERFSPLYYEISATLEGGSRELAERNKNTSRFVRSLSSIFFLSLLFFTATFRWMEERKDVACQKLACNRRCAIKKKRKKKDWGPETFRGRRSNIRATFFLLFYSRRAIYRGRQRRQKFASTAKGDQPFEGSTFLPSFFFSSFFFTPENCSLKDE